MKFGELAALGTAFCWSFGSVFFTIASARLGPVVVNRLRLAIALVLLSGAQLLIYGNIIDANLQPVHLFWFGLSGIIGFAIGDYCLFSAFVAIGPRVSMLIMALVPVFGAVSAWVFLNETMPLVKIGAIALTIAGITAVVAAKKTDGRTAGSLGRGAALAIIASLCQAAGLLLSKKGLIEGLPAMSGNIIRVLSASIAVWFAALVSRRETGSSSRCGDRKAVGSLLAGAVFGPFLGVSLSLVAINHAPIGISSTIMALPPVFLIPISRWIFKEKITLIALFGTLVAIAGVAILFLG